MKRGKLVIEIKEIEKREDATGYCTTITSEHINKIHAMTALASAVLSLAEGEQKNELMMAFTLALLEKDE